MPGSVKIGTGGEGSRRPCGKARIFAGRGERGEGEAERGGSSAAPDTTGRADTVEVGRHGGTGTSEGRTELTARSLPRSRAASTGVRQLGFMIREVPLTFGSGSDGMDNVGNEMLVKGSACIV